MNVLITGISGKLGRHVARQLLEAGHEVLGVDRRPWPDAPQGVEMFNVDLRKRPAEEVFRTHRPKAVIHMATIGYLGKKTQIERYRVNLKGTQAVFDYCHTYKVSQCIFVGRHTFYGAAADLPMFHTEDDPPEAISTYPALADLVAADLYAGSALWRHPKLATCVLRMCYTLGPSHHGTLAQYLGSDRVPTVLGFDPLFQFMHELDAAAAICIALESKARGVYNVAGPQPVPISTMIKVTGKTNWPIPEPLFSLFPGRFRLPPLSRGALGHVKFPVTVDDSRFREETGFDHRFDEIRTLESFRWSV